MFQIPVIHGYRPRSAYGSDEMWSEGRCEYERLPRKRVPPQSHPSEGYRNLINIVPKKPLLDRPGEGFYGRYYRHVDYREYGDGRRFSRDRRSGPPHRGDKSGYNWSRDDHSSSRQPGYRGMRGGFKRKSFYGSWYVRGRSPHKREIPFFRGSPVGRKEPFIRGSPDPRSRSSVNSRSYSSGRSKTSFFHRSQDRNKERPVHSSKTSRRASSNSSAVPSSKVLDKPSRVTEKSLTDAASKWAAEKLEKAGKSNVPEIYEYNKAGSTAPLFIDQPERPESKTTDGIELFEDGRLSSRYKAIAAKTKMIEQVYQQDCETFGMVVKMLVEKDPSLEKRIQFALRQNLYEIGQRCVEELKHFIAEYDTSSQDFGETF
ncbi:periphilin-1-like isoform X1 [Pteropus vampyrus]|uniref:Periphilin-1-like isoform X1 n=1 Tax=Pteropus vampyrus TaxID=132908 RepID=A0A6P6BR89_PTEVA|nr:periphilin-1-like isoform X1 [Pteropus vampyrus]